MVYGGASAEHEVSCVSAATVVRMLMREGHAVLPIGVTRGGGWFLQPAPDGVAGSLRIVERPSARVWLEPGRGLRVNGTVMPVGVVVPMIHGTFGEDGRLQAILEQCALAYIGADAQASAIGMYKLLAKLCWEERRLPVVEYCRCQIDLESVVISDELAAFVERHGYPLFVKPCNGGSSVGVSRVGAPEGLLGALRYAAQFDTCVLCERAVVGREIEFAVFDTAEEQGVVSLPGEIITDQAFYDYDTKYRQTEQATLVVPARLEAGVLEGMRRVARQAYRAIGCRDLARIDFLLQGDGRYYINEINTLPGFTAQSMFPLLCDVSGHPAGALLSSLVRRAAERRVAR